MGVKFHQARSLDDELKWFNQFVNFEFSDGPVDRIWGISRDLAILLNDFFKKRSRMSRNEMFQEYCIVNRCLESSSINDLEFKHLQGKLRQILESLMNVHQEPWSFKVSPEQPVEECVESWLEYGFGLYKEEVASTLMVEVGGLVCRSDEWPPAKGFEVQTPSLKYGRERKVSVRYVPVSLPTYLFRSFLTCIDDLPLSAFLKCKECSAYIIKVGKRDKEFCSNKCASRFGARRRRAEKKEKLLR